MERFLWASRFFNLRQLFWYGSQSRNKKWLVYWSDHNLLVIYLSFFVLCGEKIGNAVGNDHHSSSCQWIMSNFPNQIHYDWSVCLYLRELVEWKDGNESKIEENERAKEIKGRENQRAKEIEGRKKFTFVPIVNYGFEVAKIVQNYTILPAKCNFSHPNLFIAIFRITCGFSFNPYKLLAIAALINVCLFLIELWPPMHKTT